MFRLNFSKKIILISMIYLMGMHSIVKADIQQGLDALNAKKFDEAAKYFSDAFDDGEVDAAFYLGRMFELGLGGQPNRQTAVGLYVAASVKGSAPAKNRLGVMHIQGVGVLQDYEKGATLVCEAAELNDMNGQFNCGNLLRLGKGVEKDEQRAVQLFQKAAEAGHIGAKNLYAEALVQGELVERDLQKAVSFYQQTAATGNAVGLYSLALAFENGLGVDKDVEKAHAYYNLSSALEHPLAGDARTRIETTMSAEQVTNAQRFAKAWRPTTLEEKNDVSKTNDQ